MIGGINGGLGLFEPSADTYTDMMEELKHWRPHTKMAEQEFLSWHWARDGSLNTMHKKYTYQIHQLYFSTPTGTTAGETPSSFSSMVDHPDEIRVFHFSARPPIGNKTSSKRTRQRWTTAQALPVEGHDMSRVIS